MLNSIKSALCPVHPAGYPFIAGFAVATLVLFWIADPLGWIGVVLTLWCAYFFRDPARMTPTRTGLVISPADGVVSAIDLVTPPPELRLSEELRTRISVFMNVFDCHVNRAPVPGRIIQIAYTPGLFVNAELEKASEENERNALVLEMSNGVRVGVVQIAGLVARRILCFVDEGELLQAGERFGLIRFGSRVDVYLPAGQHALAVVGQRAIAGETVLADLASNEAARDGNLA